MTERTDVLVRPGTEADLEPLTAVYNHYVRETPITFDTVPFTPQERRPWLLSHLEDGRHPLKVAEHGETREILGYATAGPFRPKPAYSTSVEVTVYVAPRAVGRGVGSLLYEALFAALRDQDVHRA
jgi:phosphinothricin acetyltransferase